MRALHSRTTHDATEGGGRRRRVKAMAALGLAAAIVLTTAPLAAQADESLTPGPTVIADPSSPTGYTGHFVYYNPTATSVRFVADILLRNWADPSDTKVYQPQEYKPGLMRGGGGYDVQMTNAGGGYWVTDVPLAAGANQYWFYVNNNTNLWVADPANSPIYAPDGLTGNARRAFNKVFVPYDEAKQNFAPLAARQIELPREDSAKGEWTYVQVPGLPPLGGTIPRTIGVYLPPDYDPDRAEPYKTIYMQHGGGQDQSDWMNMGNVPVIMDNLIQDGTTEPAVVITTNTNSLGAAGQGYPNLRNVVIPFVETNYNVSTDAIDRAFAGLSAGSFVTQNLINFDADAFGYYGPWSGGVSVRATTPNLAAPYIHFGGGAWDFGLPNPAQVAALDEVGFIENTVVAGAHDFNAWNQLFTVFARDYLWQPEAFLKDEIDTLKAGVAAAKLNPGNTNALTVKLDQALKLVAKDDSAGALEVMNGFVTQVSAFQSAGKLTAEQAAPLTETAKKILFNVGYWQ
ncbi:alpha/beta hydrolase-fold protein [Microbacterium sp. BK668]|uniref:alpha/beta hydrolase n=1 Tax=Microbacterium sp. BK668 TaxID=2512118 RepID=UPI0010DBC38A|nr:alpha/beta hydrolase-fold protein [Microbacterium sp. BK668]TDN90732.1 enterochelin esterase-like enzyme [Microbacterium sp. BK668]